MILIRIIRIIIFLFGDWRENPSKFEFRHQKIKKIKKKKKPKKQNKTKYFFLFCFFFFFFFEVPSLLFLFVSLVFC